MKRLKVLILTLFMVIPQFVFSIIKYKVMKDLTIPEMMECIIVLFIINALLFLLSCIFASFVYLDYDNDGIKRNGEEIKIMIVFLFIVAQNIFMIFKTNHNVYLLPTIFYFSDMVLYKILNRSSKMLATIEFEKELE